MYYKFNTKKEAFDFIQKVNEGENIQPTIDNTTTSYAQPIDLLGIFYVIADDVTKKYTDAEAFDPFAPIDYTPPTPSTLRVAIPSYWEMLFPNDRFVVGGFDISLERTDKNVLCVDVAYLDWRAFQDELDKPENAALKRHMEVVWDYLKNEIEQHNFV
jgi:hypothetical protein